MPETEKFKKKIAIDQINRFLDRYREFNAKVLDVEYYLSLSEKDRDDLEFAYHTAGCNVAMLVDTFKDLILVSDLDDPDDSKCLSCPFYQDPDPLDPEHRQHLQCCFQPNEDYDEMPCTGVSDH